MTAHKHAALMLQYAKDAMETDRPWERWEVAAPNEWNRCEISPSWSEDHNYRRKPEMIKVGKWEFPKPITQRPAPGAIYWATMFDYSRDRKFIASAEDETLLEGNLCHLSREAAQAHADALNAICRGDV